MTFDEQHKRAVDSVTDRLRDEVERQLQATMDEVSASARGDVEAARLESDIAKRQADEALREADEAKRRVEEAVHDAETARRQAEDANRQAEAANRQADEARRLIDEANRLADEARRQADEARAAIAAAAPASTAVETPAAPADSAPSQSTIDAFRQIDAARSLTGVLDALVAAAAVDDRAAGVWLVRGEQLQHWRSVAIDSPAEEIPLEHEGAIASAARSNSVATDDDGCAVPLALAGQAVAVLFVAGTRDHAAIEWLARHAAKCLESITAFKTARAITDRHSATAKLS